MILELFPQNKKFGSYIGTEDDPTCKRNCKIIQTCEDDKEFPVFIPHIAKRNSKYHKKGEHYSTVIYNQKPLPYFLDENDQPSMAKVWKHVSTYPTVSYTFNGKDNSKQRNVIVVDNDNYFENIGEVKSYIVKTIGLSTAPMPSYIIRNKLSGHAQFGWFINPCFDKDLYNFVTKKMNAFFHADACFNGPACKNPYYMKCFDTVILDEKNIDIDDIIKYYKLNSNNSLISSISSYDIDSYQTKINHRERRQIKKFNKEQSMKESRNYYVVVKLREAIWDFMRKHNHKAPSYSEALEMSMKIRVDASVYTGKNELLPLDELKNTVKSVLSWTMSHYKSEVAGYSTKSREAARIVKSIQKLSNYTKVMKYKKDHENATQREIANEFGLSQVYICKLMKLDDNELMKLRIAIHEYESYKEDYCNNEDYLELDDVINEINSNNSLISFILSYDIDSYQTTNLMNNNINNHQLNDKEKAS